MASFPIQTRTLMGTMTRVWLTKWEWACCGDAFTVGDEIDFGIEKRGSNLDLLDVLGPALVSTVDALESHHEEEFADRLRGRVVAVHAVTREVIKRRSQRRPGHGAPRNADMPPDGDEWPAVGLGSGVYAQSRPSSFVTEVVPVSDTCELVPAHGVRFPVADHDEPLLTVAELTGEPPPEPRTRSLAGWLVDVDER